LFADPRCVNSGSVVVLLGSQDDHTRLTLSRGCCMCVPLLCFVADDLSRSGAITCSSQMQIGTNALIIAQEQTKRVTTLTPGFVLYNECEVALFVERARELLFHNPRNIKAHLLCKCALWEILMLGTLAVACILSGAKCSLNCSVQVQAFLWNSCIMIIDQEESCAIAQQN